jgi:hypothetical protein
LATGCTNISEIGAHLNPNEGRDIINQLIRCYNSLSVASYVTDSSIISEITNESNWSTGDYSGPVTGVTSGNVYFDSNLKLRYEYDGSALIRINYNTQM